MKRFLLTVAVIACLAAIIIGRLHWKSEVSQAAADAKDQISTEIDLSPVNVNSSEDAQSGADKDSQADGTVNVKAKTVNLPTNLQEQVTKAYKDNKTVKVVIAGGNATKGIADQLNQDLTDAYGKKVFNIVGVNFGDKNSLDVYQGKLYEKVVEEAPDAIIFTALLINDNGQVSTRDSTHVPVLIGDRIHAELPKVTYMVEPPNPVSFFDGINERANDLKTAVEASDFTYLDHTSRWPSGDELSSVLGSAGRWPNKKGITIWEGYLNDFFTGGNIRE